MQQSFVLEVQSLVKQMVAFPGQGAQKIGMAEGLGEKGRLRFEEASAILDYDLTELCMQGPVEKLNDTRYAQGAILATTFSMYEEAKGLAPGIFLGHSLGQITALTAAGSISFGDAVRIAKKRGELMGRASSSGMVALLGLSEEEVLSLIVEVQKTAFITLANKNAPDQMVVSGTKEALSLCCERAKEKGAKRVVPLAVSGAFHSPLMQSVALEFEAFLQGFSFADPRIPLLSNYGNKLVTKKEEILPHLVSQLTEPVDWVQNILWCEQRGWDDFIEVSPTPILGGLTKRITKNMKITLVRPNGV